MMTFWLLLASIAINLTLLYACRNVLKKNETFEENQNFIVEENEQLWEYIVFTQNDIAKIIEQMKMIDRHGSFQTDDEVGIVFRRLQHTIENLENYINGSEETRKEQLLLYRRNSESN